MAEAALWGLLTSGSLLVGAGLATVLRPGTRVVGFAGRRTRVRDSLVEGGAVSAFVVAVFL